MNIRLLLCFSLLLGWLSVAGRSQLAFGADCIPECEGGYYCSAGKCQRCNVPGHSPGQCITCSEERECSELIWRLRCDRSSGVCVPPCSSSEDCPPSQVCEAGSCFNRPSPCKSDAMCPPGSVCDLSDGACRQPRPAMSAGEGCSTDPTSGARDPSLAALALSLLAGIVLACWRRLRYPAREAHGRRSQSR